MSKIVFLGSPAFGHVNPTLPVVQELVQRGEQVSYYNTEEFRSPIERTGAAFCAYPETEMSAKEISNALQDGDLSNIASLILGATESLLPFLINELPREKADLVIFDSMALWGRMAATALDLPAAASISHFILDTRQFMSGDVHALRYLRQMLPKLPRLLLMRMRLTRRYKTIFPEAPLIPVRGGLNLMYTSRTLQPESSVIDDTFRFVGPSINPQTRDKDFPFAALEQAPVVYISLGTIHTAQLDFYRQCFEAFGDYSGQFVLSVGHDTDVTALGSIPPNFIVRPSVPQLDVLQRATVFITHGGLNSIHEGLYYGVPLVLIPHHLEQFLNARCVERQGAGVIIEQPLAGKPVTTADLRQALETILSESRYREGAAKVQQTLQATGGYRQAADEIQAYLTRLP